MRCRGPLIVGMGLQKMIFNITFFLCLYAGSVLAVTDQEIFDQLTNIHGSNWQALIRSDEDRIKIKSTLATILTSPEKFYKWNSLEDFEKENLTHNAMSEFGHFVGIAENGKMVDADLKIFKKQQQTFNGDYTAPGSVSWFEGLKNTASVDAFKELLSLANSLDPQELALKYTILRICQEFFISTENNDFNRELSDFDQYHNFAGVFAPHLQNLIQSGDLENNTWINLKAKLISEMQYFASDVKTRDLDLYKNVQVMISNLKPKSKDKDVSALVVLNDNSDSADEVTHSYSGNLQNKSDEELNVNNAEYRKFNDRVPQSAYRSKASLAKNSFSSQEETSESNGLLFIVLGVLILAPLFLYKRILK